MYEVYMTGAAREEYGEMDGHLQDRFDKKVKKLEGGPDVFGKPLRGEMSGLWELYFEGSFRILYTIDRDNKNVTIRGIRHKDDF